MKENHFQSFTPAQTAELKELGALPDDKINLREVPEQRDWSGARRRVFYRLGKVGT